MAGPDRLEAIEPLGGLTLLKGDSAPRPKAVLKAQPGQAASQHVSANLVYAGFEARAGESPAAGPARCSAACSWKLNEGPEELQAFAQSILAYLYQKSVRDARRQGPCEATEFCRAGTGEAPASPCLFKMKSQRHVAWLLGQPQTNGGARHVVSRVIPCKAPLQIYTCLSFVDVHFRIKHHFFQIYVRIRIYTYTQTYICMYTYVYRCT